MDLFWSMLTPVWVMFTYYTPWKHYKTKGFKPCTEHVSVKGKLNWTDLLFSKVHAHEYAMCLDEICIDTFDTESEGCSPKKWASEFFQFKELSRFYDNSLFKLSLCFLRDTSFSYKSYWRIYEWTLTKLWELSIIMNLDIKWGNCK